MNTQDNESFWSEQGELGNQVFQYVDDPNEIVVIFQWDGNEDPRAFFQSEETRERMADVGLVAPPDLTLVELVYQKAAQQPSAKTNRDSPLPLVAGSGDR